jgi:hypothetical protein
MLRIDLRVLSDQVKIRWSTDGAVGRPTTRCSGPVPAGFARLHGPLIGNVGRREIHPAAHRAQTRRHAGHARKGVAGLAQALSSAGTGMSARVLTPFELSVQDEAAQDRAYSS